MADELHNGANDRALSGNGDHDVTDVKVVWEVIEGPHAGRRFEFGQHDSLIAGRCPSLPLPLTDDPHFSRYHFLLEVNPPEGLLRDLGSTNGTFVNGRRVSEAQLEHGDIVSGGRTRMRFSVSPPPALLDDPPAATRRDTLTWMQHAGEAQRGRDAKKSAPMEDMPAVEGFEMIRRLGRGGMGVVYLARQLATQREVALKLMVPESAASETAVRRFLREASVLSQLEHKRIVRFLDLGMSQGRFFFAMEYVEAVDLLKELRARPFPSRIKAACGLVCQMLEGLCYAHAKSFVHRDIKPNNLLASRAGGRLRSKLADFGLAKNFQNAGFSGMTHTGDALGTVAFMAPEQLSDGRLAKPSVDVYAAGATLYWLLCERFVYDSPPRNALLALLEDDHVPLRNRCEVPESLDKVVSQALAREPSDRFPSAAAMWKALEPFARGK